MTRGSVAAVLEPGSRTAPARSSSSCVADQPALDGQYTVFGRVVGGHRGRAEDLGDAGRCAEGSPAERVEIDAVTIRDTPPPEPVPFSTESAERAGAAIAPCSTPAPGRSRSSSFPTRRPSTCASSCGWRRPASTTGWRSIASSRLRHSDRRAEDARAADREAAEARPQPAAGVQRHQAREGHRVDGARRRSGERDDVVLHRHRGSQSLDGKYTAFGRVVDGMAAVDAIEQAPVTARRR